MLRRRTSTKQTGKSERARARAALNFAPDPTPQAEAAAPEGPPPPIDPLNAHDTLGQALRAVRLDKGLTVQEVADQTRVRRAYLEAIEEMRLDALPSRPFTIGYIRAYATHLGLNPDLAVERFKSDEPVLDEPLRAPVGVLDEKDPRVAAFLIGALVIIAAIVLWNVAQRAMTANAPAPALASEGVTAKALAGMKSGAVELGAPLPAPVESTTPPPYETPGLAEALGLKADPASADKPKPANQAATVNLAALPPYFQVRGKVFDSGKPALSSVVTVQALKPGSLIVRGPDGSVYFARQLAAGDAYKVPQIAGLTLDVSEPHDFQVFVGGQTRGVLPAAQVLASKLGTPAPTAAAAPIKPAIAPAAAPAAAAAPPKLALPRPAPPKAPAPKTP